MSRLDRIFATDDLEGETITLADYHARPSDPPGVEHGPPQVPSTPGAPRQNRDWMGDAACRGLDPAIFHPELTVGQNGYAPARAICTSCPVRDACLRWALDHNERDGMWGGLTHRQRIRLGYRAPCRWCGTPTPVRDNNRYCSDDCRVHARAHQQTTWADDHSKETAA